MEPFTIKAHLTKKEYTKLVLLIYFTRPVIVFFIVVLSLVLLWEYGFSKDLTGSFSTVLGLWTVYVIVFPLYVLTFGANRAFKQSQALQYGASYTFTTEGMTAVTKGINSNINWEVFRFRREKSGYLLLYPNRVSAHILPLSNLSAEQADFIRQKVAKKKK